MANMSTMSGFLAQISTILGNGYDTVVGHKVMPYPFDP